MDTTSPILVVDDEQDIPNLFQMKFRRQIRKQERCFMFAQNGKKQTRVEKYVCELVQGKDEIRKLRITVTKREGMEWIQTLQETQET